MEQSGEEPVDVGPEIEQFANALDDCLSPLLTQSEKRQRLLQLPRIYYQNTVRRLENLEASIADDGAEDMDMDSEDREPSEPTEEQAARMTQLRSEAQTWDLIRRVLPLRYGDSASTTARSLYKAAGGGKHDLWHEFLQNDSVAQERFAIVQWLQTNAASGPEIDKLVQDLQQNADRGDIIAHGWLHTRSAIKLRKSVTAWPHLLDRQSSDVARSHVNADGAPLVTHLDPDAVTRQDRKLEPQDEYFERAIWLGCFEHLRRGSSMEVIRDWCQERTEMWRAISVSAMPLSCVEDEEATIESAPSSIALWRRMCFGLSRQGGCDDYERAVYGLLSGDVISVEKVAQTWDDFLFANYNALLRTQFDNFALSQCSSEDASDLTQSFSAFDAIQFLGDENMIEKRLMSSLESKKNIGGESMDPVKALQASIVGKNIHEHLHAQGMIISQDANLTEASSLMPLPQSVEIKDPMRYFALGQEDGLRIVAHIFLLITLLESLNEVPNDTVGQRAARPPAWAQENILAAYTGYLNAASMKDLIPLYCSVLPSPRREEVLSCNLISEQVDSERRHLLKLVDKAGINVVDFLKTQARLMYNQAGLTPGVGTRQPVFKILVDEPPTAHHGRTINPDFVGEDDTVDTKHANLVQAIEWLLMEPMTWPLAFSFAVKIYKFFLQNLHLNAARLLMEKVSIDGYLSSIFGVDAFNELPQDIEYWAEQVAQSASTGISAQQAMTDARDFRDLEALVKALDNVETMSSLAEISPEMPASNRSFWAKVGEEMKATKDNMQPLLQGWLLASIEEGDEELRQIRQIYLPETVLAYVSALHFGGTNLSRDHLLESMELATVVARQNSDLASSFVEAERMKELVEALTACSKALAVATGEKRAMGASSKKLREKGWSRDLWSVKS